MAFSKDTTLLLQKHKVDPIRGFLPAQDPLLLLPDAFSSWETLANNFTDYLNAGIIREQILKLPLIENPVFKNPLETERAMLILSMFSHAYVNAAPEKSDHIPPCLSIPWLDISKQLGRTPVLSHASLVLHNWRRLNMDKPISLDNLATLFQFHGGLDESWFYLITVEIEHVGGPAIAKLLEGIQHIKNEEIDKALEILNDVFFIIKKMCKVLCRMYENCEPQVFYKRIRPFLDSFVNVDYQKTELGKQNFHGGSAAQSSLIQFFDAIMGNTYKDIPGTNHYLLEMRKYMPAKHAAFLEFIESVPSFQKYAEKHLELKIPNQKIIDALIEFRNEHLKMVGIYIMQQAKAHNKEAVGTGGTNPLLFLKSIRNKNEDQS